jgi:uncharacterized protein DUF1360
MTTKQQRIEEEQHVWNGIALIVYIALCALSVWLIARYGTFDPNALSFLDLAVLGLAAFRLVHLITYDKIFDTVRAVFMDREGTRLKSAERGWRRLMCEFMQCIWCTGLLPRRVGPLCRDRAGSRGARLAAAASLQGAGGQGVRSAAARSIRLGRKASHGPALKRNTVANVSQLAFSPAMLRP